VRLPRISFSRNVALCYGPLLPASPIGTLGLMSRTLIIFGLVLVATGLLWPFLSKLGLGRLPGDIVIERENFTFYLPLGTSLLISFVLSLIFWLLGR
jgi:hypothetical protein